MLFKVALVVALGSIGLIAVRQLTEPSIADTVDEEQARLEQAVAAQLQSLRDHLFKR